MEENGKWDYLCDSANQVDLTTFLVFLYYYVCRFHDQANPLVSVVEIKDQVEIGTDEVKRIF